MNDLEHEIRQILDEDAHDAPLISSAPAGITRRVRRRQVGLATVASLCTVVIGIGLIAGFRAFTPSDGAVPGETTEATHPGEIASGSESGLGSWWLTAGTTDGMTELAFHVPDWSISMQVLPIPAGDGFGAMGYGPIDTASEAGWFLVMGIVDPDASRVELRMDDGRTVVANLAPIPEGSAGDPMPQAYVAVFRTTGDPTSTVHPGGTVVAVDADGNELDRQDLVDPHLLKNRQAAQMDLRNAFVAALTFYTDAATFVGFTPGVAASLEPSLTYNASPTVVTDEISIRDVRERSLVLVTMAKDGSVWCIAAQDAVTGETTYGVVDAPTADECISDDAAWAVPTSTATPSPSSSPSSTESSMHGIASGTDLGETWTLSGSLDHQQYCVQLETEGTGSGTCGAAAQGGGPIGPPGDRPALAMTDPVSLGEFLVETVPNSVDRIEVTTPSGETFTGLCADPHLIPQLMSRGIRFCVVPLAGSGDGTMRFLTADGTQAFASQPIAWNDAGSAGATGSSGSSGP